MMMTYKDAPLFSFSRHDDHADLCRAAIREFAASLPYRSAHVDELELDEDFHRRPARPEDLSFLKFRTPVAAETFARLPFLASNRLLLSINEMATVRFPTRGDPQALEQFAQYYGDGNQLLGARIRPFLEDYAFAYLCEDSLPTSITDLAEALVDTVKEESRFWGQMLGWLSARRYLEEGLRFILIQNWSLMPSRRAAIAQAQLAGYFEPVAIRNRPSLQGALPDDTSIAALARQCGLTKREHSYWQFYLSTSMARSNLLYALSRRADRALAFYGAAFDAEAHRLASACLIGQASEALGLGGGDKAIDPLKEVDELVARFRATLEVVAVRFGEGGLREVAKGLAASRKLGNSARSDLGAQLRWLSSVEQFRIFAHEIDMRISAECPDIDRETFVEPREMCSTTHVHDDHRLVSIESGDMVFWGNLGMKLKLRPGEMVLVPEGRLHGSSIESEECIYHQPIIPESWFQELMSRVEMAPA